MKLISQPMLLITLFFSALVFNPLFSQAHKDTLSVLFVGNSYTYVENLPHLVSELSEGTPIKLMCKKSVVGGANLSEHWHGKRGLKTRELIEAGDFDIVVLQNHSMSALERPDSLMKYVSLLCDLAREHGAKPFLYVTWAREKVPQFQDEINTVYLKAASQNDAIPVMVGDAWALAEAYRPTIQLYDPDGSHPSGMGAYLTASLFVMELCGSLPEMMAGAIQVRDAFGETLDLMWVDPLDGVFIKKVVMEVVNSHKTVEKRR